MSTGEGDMEKPKTEFPLVRRLGMQEVSLQTGFYGVDGKRIKHQVHKGALQLPAEALHIYAGDEEPKEKNQINLPPLDYVKRPSLDERPCVQTIIRRHERVEESVNPLDGTLQRVVRGNTVIRNEIMKKEKSDPPAARIRGGGEGDEPPPQDLPQAANATTTAVASNPGGGPQTTSQGAFGSISVSTSIPPPAAAPSTSTSIQATNLPLPVVPTPQQTQTQPGTSKNLPAPPISQPAAPSSTALKRPSQPVVTGSMQVPPATPTVAPPQVAPSSQPAAVSSNVAPPQVALSSQPAAVSSNVAPPQVAPSSQPAAVSSNPLPAVAPQPAAPSSHPVPPTTAVKPKPSTTATADSKLAPPVSKPPSATTIPQETKPDPPEPKVVPLKKKPASQWEQRSASAEELAQAPKPSPKPDWYKKDEASDLERSILPEWFDGSAKHRTPGTFVETREKVIAMASKLNRYLTSTLLRRAIPGDSGSLIRLHRFLTSYSLINEKKHGTDSAPTPEISIQSSRNMRKRVLNAVTDQVNAKKARMEDGKPVVDWKTVAASVQNGMSAASCERIFLAAADNNNTTSQGSPQTPFPSFVNELIQNSDAKVVTAVINAALEASEEVNVAQTASIAGLAVAATEATARFQEDAVGRIMSEIVDLRMQKLEERLQIVDDVEEMLETERLALSLERRDLYTARCRHWFGRT